jgi:hypothetical protein
MATFRQRGLTWRAEVYKHGHRDSATFPSKRQAAAWAHKRESELELLPAAAAPVPTPADSAHAERQAARDAAGAFCSLRAA